MKIVNSVEINATTEKVFYWLSEPERAKHWVQNVTRTEYINETPDKVGTTFREYVEEDGQAIEMQGVVTAFQPNELFAVHLESAVHSVDVRFVLKQRGGLTVLVQDVDMQFKNPLSAEISAALKKHIEDQAQAEFARLKTLCEQVDAA